MQLRVGKHHFIAQRFGVQCLPAFQRDGFATLARLQGLAAGFASKVGGDVGAVAVGLHFNDQRFAVGALDDEVGRVGVPATIIAEIFGEQIGLAGIGETAGEPDAVDLVRVVFKQRQRPFEKFAFGCRIKVVALVVKAALARELRVTQLGSGDVERFAVGREADASGVDRRAVDVASGETVSFDQRDGNLNDFFKTFVVTALRLDLTLEGTEVMHGDFCRAVSGAQCAEHFGHREVVICGEFGGGGVDGRHISTIRHRAGVARIATFQAGVAALRFDQRVGADGGRTRHGNAGNLQRERHRFSGGLAADAQHAPLDEQRRNAGLVQHDLMLFALGMLQPQVAQCGAKGFGELAL